MISLKILCNYMHLLKKHTRSEEGCEGSERGVVL